MTGNKCVICGGEIRKNYRPSPTDKPSARIKCSDCIKKEEMNSSGFEKVFQKEEMKIMFGKKKIMVEIDYAKLAQEVVNMQLEKLRLMDDETIKYLFKNALAVAEEHINNEKAKELTPIGRVSEKLLKDYQDHCDEANGLEELISDILMRKAKLARERRSLGNQIEIELGKPLSLARIDLKTGDIYYIKSEDVEN